MCSATRTVAGPCFSGCSGGCFLVEAFARYSLSHVVRAQLACEDLRCRYYAGVYLLKHWMLNQRDKYWRSLRHVLGTAQQLNDERLVDRGRGDLGVVRASVFAHLTPRQAFPT
ncbi:hypothetical protein HYH03_010345 [Edaphochlamys debaryana]|uniref:Uncharacterized protein n=1 Tax=Edaphochlamys debaryana TaxID=47281 RepID=A0A835XW73_9CHLO|nr:hypothetical protein HYH03_010345 [Edaphochlamys debaryana]|eukprot:KAG2491343.1 hypothetical protein HYH03_010345 [Edaphochlamys debaryana]